ncbi:MAG TPA: TolC family protein [Polyangia bacterium]|nr:TolC family protein [Polyangia bacterium]
MRSRFLLAGACASLAGLALPSSGPGVAFARTLDRRGAIRAALVQNPQVAAARAEEAAAQAQLRQVDAARAPMLTLDGGVGPSLVASLVPGTATQSIQDQYRNFRWSDLSAVFVGELRVIQPLYTFGKIALRGEAASHGLRARQAQTRMQRADVAFEVAQLYESCLYARDVERFLNEIDHWLDSTLQATQTKLVEGAGSVTDRDVLRLQSARALAAMGLNQARAGLAQARGGLAAYLGIPADEPLTFAEEDLVPVGRVPQTFAELGRLALGNRPEVVALREGQGALSALGRAEAAGLWPNLFLMAFVSAAYTPGRDWIQSRFVLDPLNHFAPGALLGFRWELQGNMAASRAAEQQAHADALARLGDWAGAGIPAQVRQAYEDVQRTEKDIAEGHQAIGQAKRWMVESSADYGVGLLDVREVSDAVQAYVTLRVGIFKARFDHNVAMAALSRATGTLDGDAEIFYLDRTPTEETTP